MSIASHTQLNVRHRYAALLVATGKTHTEVAQEMGIAPGTVGGWAKSQLFKEEVARQTTLLAATIRTNVAERVTEFFDTNAEDMAQVITTLARNAEHESTQLKAAESALDRSSIGIMRNAQKYNGRNGTGAPAQIAPDANFLQSLLQAAMDTGAEHILASFAINMPQRPKSAESQIDNIDNANSEILETEQLPIPASSEITTFQIKSVNKEIDNSEILIKDKF